MEKKNKAGRLCRVSQRRGRVYDFNKVVRKGHILKVIIQRTLARGKKVTGWVFGGTAFWAEGTVSLRGLGWDCAALFEEHQKSLCGQGWLRQFSSVPQSCPTLCNPMNRSTPGLPVHHQLPEFTHTHAHRVSDAIQPSHPLSSPSPPAPNPSKHHLFQWVSTSQEVARVLEVQEERNKIEIRDGWVVDGVLKARALSSLW